MTSGLSRGEVASSRSGRGQVWFSGRNLPQLSGSDFGPGSVRFRSGRNGSIGSPGGLFQSRQISIYRTEKPANSSYLPCAYGLARRTRAMLHRERVFQSVVAAGHVGAADFFA
jgi:hypothetical protein